MSFRIPFTATILVGSLLLAAYVVRDDIEVNGDSRVAMVYAMVDRGTFAVEDYVPAAPAVAGDLSEHDGHLYTAKPPLPSLIVAPVYAALRLGLPPADLESWWWRWALTIVGAGLPFALLPFAMSALVKATDGRMASRARMLASWSVVVATPLVVYATVFFSHVLAALLLLGLLAVTVAGPRRPFLAGLLAGALLSTELLPAAAGLVLLAYGGLTTLLEKRRGAAGDVARATAGLLLGAAPLLLYVWAAFGSPAANMYATIGDPIAREAYATRPLQLPQPNVILYLLFSPQQGLFVFAPLVVVGAFALYRRWIAGGVGRRAAELSVLAFGTGLLVLSMFTLWHDGSQYGPRYLVPFIPLLVWPLVSWPARRLAIVAGVLAIPQLMALSIHEPMLAPGSSTYLEVVARFFGGRLDPNMLGIALGRLGLPDADLVGAAVLLVTVIAIVTVPRWRGSDL